MSFSSKNLSKKPSLLKPIAIFVACFLLLGAVFFAISTKSNKDNSSSGENKENSKETEKSSSSLDKDKRVKNVGDVEEVIAKWIENNPKLIIEAVSNMQKKDMEEKMKDAGKNIKEKSEEIFNDNSSPSYSDGEYDVTIVEFFDYTCGYCKRAQVTVDQLLKSDKKVRVVYKELPILGPQSQEMSEVSLALYMMDSKMYKKFHDALMKSNEKGKSGAMKVAKSIGIDIAKLEKSLKSNNTKIKEAIQKNGALASDIGINGTPGFIIGEDLVPGALDLDSFKEKVASVRSQKK